MERIVLAYSGSLDTSVAIPWLADANNAEIITVTIDLGQGRELEEVRDRALATGALRAHVLDEREPFARAYLMRGLRADTTGTGSPEIARALSQLLVAEKLVQIAAIESATTVAHGAPGDAIDTAAHTLNPSINVLAPARDWAMRGGEVMDYAHARNVPLPPDGEPLLAMAAPSEPAIVEVAFERGLPIGINGVAMPTLDLFESLGTIALVHGVARTRRRDLRDAPAAIVLFAAHKALLGAVSTDARRQTAADVNARFLSLVAAGRWFTPDRDAIDAELQKTNARVTGSVRIKLAHGACEILETHPTDVAPANALTVVRTS